VSFLDRDIAENNMLSNGDLSVDPLAIVLSCWCDPTFGHFGRTPTCDRQTDRQTNRHGARATASALTVGQWVTDQMGQQVCVDHVDHGSWIM